jgi:hypothetical protein
MTRGNTNRTWFWALRNFQSKSHSVPGITETNDFSILIILFFDFLLLQLDNGLCLLPALGSLLGAWVSIVLTG